METEFLCALGLEQEAAEAVLRAHEEDLERERCRTRQAEERLEELQSRYDADTGALRDSLAERDYADAVKAALARADGGKGLHFSSRAAEESFRAALRRACPAVKDGVPEGFEDFLQRQRETDPGAFVLPDKPQPRFALPVGAGGAGRGKSRAAEIARQYQSSLYGTEKGE